ncbi:MAG: hypothetical protein AAFQ89_06500 [Cyanobacteria bacterium J06626_18]
MWFRSKTEPEQPDLQPQDVWSALQSHRRLDQQQQRILELESRLQRAETWMRTSIVLLGCAFIASILVVSWNTYQLHQWRQQIEAPTPR